MLLNRYGFDPILLNTKLKIYLNGAGISSTKFLLVCYKFTPANRYKHM